MKLLEAPMVIEGKEVKAVRELPWYAGGLAYRLGCDRRFIRKQPHLVSYFVVVSAVGLVVALLPWTLPQASETPPPRPEREGRVRVEGALRAEEHGSGRRNRRYP